MAHKLESHHPYSGHDGAGRGGKVHTTDELNESDHLCPSSKKVAPLPDANRETWKEEDFYSMQPTNGEPNHMKSHRE